MDAFFCARCNRPTPHLSNYRVPHLVYGLVTSLAICIGLTFWPLLLFGGLWLVVWLVHALLASFNPCRCKVCGATHAENVRLVQQEPERFEGKLIEQLRGN